MRKISIYFLTFLDESGSLNTIFAISDLIISCTILCTPALSYQWLVLIQGIPLTE